MKKVINVLVLVLAITAFSLAAVGCHNKSEHPASDHPTSKNHDHASEHPTSDHTDSDHPK